MNERDLLAKARAELENIPLSDPKRMRKAVRKTILKDLQRRAITGEPSPFKRFVPEAHQ
ncbi:hypothetical protein K32_48630 [Kaistia sp. 32K]|uniref:hypothetical protein n=1 Tax=Kaistia sp. 32K TaxID=2795690 RepID=UPI00191535A4|nr:hypothetical protein [Kaistia sp. 32K]BCP56246.1 hypothetical protein K32_48630 [Kaistia sp. 32K]